MQAAHKLAAVRKTAKSGTGAVSPASAISLSAIPHSKGGKPCGTARENKSVPHRQFGLTLPRMNHAVARLKPSSSWRGLPRSPMPSPRAGVVDGRHRAAHDEQGTRGPWKRLDGDERNACANLRESLTSTAPPHAGPQHLALWGMERGDTPSNFQRFEWELSLWRTRSRVLRAGRRCP